jgi:DNA polymerase II large subunit
MVEMSEEMEQYFDRIQDQVDECYEIAGKAREKGYDPELYVECPQARDLAGRVEKLVGPEGVAEVIRNLKDKGLSEDQITFKVVSDILDQKIGNIEELEQRVERAIRVGLAIKTMGVVSAPLEGISKIKIRKNQEGGEYLSIYFAGPIRAAGGTTAGLCVLIADFVRKKSGISKYEATESEVGRFVEEVQLYSRVVNLQYPAKDQEIRFAVEHLPVEINGDSTRNEEVSAFRNLPRIETNQLRGGACLVLNDGILLKSPKLLKIADNMDLEGWDWLGKIKKIAHKEGEEEKKEEKAQKEHKNKEKIAPNGKYIADIIAGRPVFSYPSRIGGHRIRYGRSRNTGLAAGGFHPATMELMDRFVAIGTQLRTERPGKSTSICPVSSIEPPIVKLKSGDVIRVNTVRQARQIFSDIERILFIGDILFGFGEFAENNHKLLPSGYVEEWWAVELEEKLEEENHVDEKLRKIINDPFNQIPTANEALAISKKYKIPLHPKYTDFWGNVSVNELIALRNAFLEGYKEDEQKIVLDFDPEIKAILEKAFVIHNVKDDHIIFSRAMNTIYITIFNLEDPSSREFNRKGTFSDFFNELTSIEIKNKAPYYMGTRMGRPEKSQRKSMKGVHTLFPLSTKVGNTRLVEDAMKLGKIKVDICRKKCTKCGAVTIFNQCTKCGGHTELQKICKKCNKLYPKNTDQCPKCQGNLVVSDDALFNFKKHVGNILNNLKFHLPDKMKGIYGLTNRFSVPEPIEKGILRARNDVLVYKTAEIRYDATDIPLTHFKPKEVGISLEKLKDLGYTKDIKGDPIQSEDQIIELKAQDVILSDDCANYMVKVANFLDDELDLFYGLQRYYNVQKKEDLIGELIVGLAPHTSAGIVGRVVGFSPARSIYSHPYWHAAKRRNCFPGESKLLVYINGNLKRIKFKTLYDKYFQNEKKLDFGYSKRDKKDDIKVVSFDPESKRVKTTNIIDTIKTPTPNKLIRIELRTGRTYLTTPKHPVYVVSNNKMETKRALEIEVGDYFVLPKLNIEETEPNTIDLLDEFSDPKFKDYWDKIMLRGVNKFFEKIILSHGLKETASSLNINKKTLNNYYKSRDSIPLNIAKKILDIYEIDFSRIPDCKLGYKRDHTYIPRKIEITEDFGRLIGYYIAEGHYRKGKRCYQVDLANIDEDIRGDMKRCIRKVFGRGLKINEDDFQLVFSNHLIYLIFKEIFLLSNSSRSKHIPSMFLQFPKDILSSLLSAYFAGDGSVDPNHPEVNCSTFSKQLALDIDTALLRFGIFSSINSQKRGENTTEYKVRLYGKNILKFANKIGFSSNRKKQSLKSSISNLKPKDQIKFGNNKLIPVHKVEIVPTKERFVYSIHAENYNSILINENIVTHQCDGDEDGVMLLLDPLLNFSRHYLPDKIGGRMDATLVISSVLDPNEIDTEAHNVDVMDKYPLEFYRATEHYSTPKEVGNVVKLVDSRLGSPQQYEGINYNIPTDDINAGPTTTAYKTYTSMDEKIHAQLHLGQIIDAVDEKDVARKIISSHFNPDILGNLRKFGQQEFRCVKCNTKFRRPPISNSGKCPKCGNNIILTVNRGGIEKYIPRAIRLCEEFELDKYTVQRMELIEQYVESLTNNPRIKQQKLSQFF